MVTGAKTMKKKDFYKKPLKFCPCCKWPGSIDQMNKKKWLSVKKYGHAERLNEETQK